MAAATLGIVAALTEMKMGKFKSKVNNHGEIEFEGGAGVNGTRKAHPVRIRIDELVQIDTNGNDLASCTEATNPTKPGMGWMKNKARKAAMKKRLRKFRGFANQTFVVGARKLKAAMRNGGGMKAAMQRFSASLPDAMGKMVIKLVMPEEAGEVDIGGEKQKLKIGDTKFNIEMSEWNWCDNSAFIDVYVVVSSKKHPMKRHPRGKTVPATYNLGDNMTLSFSGKVGHVNRYLYSLGVYPDFSLIIGTKMATFTYNLPNVLC